MVPATSAASARPDNKRTRIVEKGGGLKNADWAISGLLP
jgi:hypothetical protein